MTTWLCRALPTLALVALGCASESERPTVLLGLDAATMDASSRDGGSSEPKPVHDPGAIGARDPAQPADAGASLDSGAPRVPARLAHNIIVFMGDGMGPEQLSTGRYVKSGGLRIDELEGPAFANTDSLTTVYASSPALNPTDSAAAATAIATGVLVTNGVVSLAASGAALETVLETCKRAGKATGLVTTSYFFDASPAAFSSHQASRGAYESIVRQMLVETQPDVIMGDGAWLFDDPSSGLHAAAALGGYFVVRGVEALAAWDPRASPRILGLFTTDFVPVVDVGERFTMTPALERRADSPDPTLATMTARALERLAADPDGFFLFAEDETFDQIGHRGPSEVAWSNRAYPQQSAALDDALSVAIDWVHEHSSFEQTLIVLLADHETGGYQYDHNLGPDSGTFSAPSGSSGNHTRTRTAVYALGPGSEHIAWIRGHVDTYKLLIGALR